MTGRFQSATHMIRSITLAVLLAALFSACAPAASQTSAPVAQMPTPTPPESRTSVPTLMPTPTLTPSPTATFVPLEPTATLAPLALAEREQIFDQVWTLVRDNYVYADYGGLDWNAVREEFAPRVAAAATTADFYGMLREMILRLGDEHSRFESPQEVAQEQALFNGDLNYGGIGAIVRTVEAGGLIVGLADGGPAAEAGLQPRDLIMAINGIPFTDTTAFGPEGPIGAVRGEPGSTVQLTVRSIGSAPRQVLVTRRAIPASAFPDIEAHRLPGTQIGLVQIYTFNAENLDRRMRERLEGLTRDVPLDGLIVDVRSNSGGRVDLLLNTLALFVDGGSIGSQSGRAMLSELTIPGDQVLSQLVDVPMVVLISSETVSAAEMFAAGLQTLGRAQIVGTPSAGNTENLRPHTFADGSRLWLAELTYRLPDGSLIEGRGVLPDREVDAEWWNYELARDPQIRAAIEELRAAALASNPR